PIATPVTSGVVIEAGVARRFNVRIPLRDGVTLSADLALPGALPAPAVVARTPYGKTGERNSQRAATFAKAGYACPLVDVRRRGGTRMALSSRIATMAPTVRRSSPGRRRRTGAPAMSLLTAAATAGASSG